MLKKINLYIFTYSCLLRYGTSVAQQSANSVRINRSGDQILALRRRLPPILYSIHSNKPLCEFDHTGYFNSCTMKSCCFAGDKDQVTVTGVWIFSLVFDLIFLVCGHFVHLSSSENCYNHVIICTRVTLKNYFKSKTVEFLDN